MIKKKVFKAHQWADKYHEGITRRYSGLPYLTHPVHVARTLEQFGCSEIMVSAALMHDLIEDTEVTYEMLVEEFGVETADLVLEVTTIEEDKVAAGGKRMYLANKVCIITEDALTLKLADRFHNVLFLEHDAAPIDFITKYFKETKFIISTLINDGRELNEAQRALIMRIKAILEFLRIRYEFS